MAKISVLSKEISELIAAGEVIERPASVIKELVENAIDAEAKHITVEIKRGGTTYMRITDDGCGMYIEDVPTAFLRHATSKIKAKDDLESIYTLGFRGEALASVAAVARVSLLTKRREEDFGTHYEINGSVPEGEPEQTGCPDGTTIIIRDLFYNVPVRQRFMKKDVSEANAVSQIVQKIALSHPDIAFRMIRDNRMEFCTDGSGDLYAAIYSIYGKEFAHDMIPVDFNDGYITVKGYTCKPLYAKSSRAFQNFFINGRYIRSRVLSASMENAYENLIMTGKFPSCVLMLSMNAADIDVNVHPTKAEVRFTNEKAVVDGMYFGIKNALLQSGLIYEFHIQKPKEITDWTAPVPEEPVYKQTSFSQTDYNTASQPEPVSNEKVWEENETEIPETSLISDAKEVCKPAEKYPEPLQTPASPATEVFEEAVEAEPVVYCEENIPGAEPFRTDSEEGKVPEKSIPETHTEEDEIKDEVPAIKVVGELFKNYIIAEAEDKMIIFDKHAAHERVLFEKLKSELCLNSRQMLMSPVSVLLGAEEASVLMDNEELMETMGFTFEFKELPYVKVTEIPTFAQNLNTEELVSEIAHNLVIGKSNPQPEYLDDTLHTIACKAAIKANDKNDLCELQKLAQQVYMDERIRHCPHGRPVMFVISKYELEKQFRRV